MAEGTPESLAESFIVVRAPASLGHDGACGAILDHSLALVVYEEIKLVGDFYEARVPLSLEFFGKLLSRDMSGFTYNDGPDCYACGRPNERKP